MRSFFAGSQKATHHKTGPADGASALITDELIAEMMDRLADARLGLNSALRRVPESEQVLRANIESTLKGIDSTRLKVLKVLADSAELPTTPEKGHP